MSEKVKRRYLEIVCIRWVDIEVIGEWKEVTEIGEPLIPIVSVGYLLSRDLDKYVIAADYDVELDTANRIMSIPRGCVVGKISTLGVIPLKVKR